MFGWTVSRPDWNLSFLIFIYCTRLATILCNPVVVVSSVLWLRLVQADEIEDFSCFYWCVPGWREMGPSLAHRDCSGRGSSTAKQRLDSNWNTIFRQNKYHTLAHISITLKCNCIRQQTSSVFCFSYKILCTFSFTSYISGWQSLA